MGLVKEKWGREFSIYLNVDPSSPISRPYVDVTAGAFTSGGEALHAAFNTRRHVLLEPMPCTVTIYNMPASDRADLTKTVDEARKKSARDQTAVEAGTVSIVAGYEGDTGLLGIYHIIDAKHAKAPASADIVTTIMAQDGRIPWKNAFVNEEGIPGVPLAELQGVLDAAADWEAGLDVDESYAKVLPNFTKVNGGSPGAQSGFTMFGPARNVNQNLLETLGLRAFFDGAGIRMIVAGSADWAEAVQLQIGEDVIVATRRERGFVDATTLLDHRLMPGRQVKLIDPLGVPVGSTTFRVDDVEHLGSNFGVDYFSRVILRPTGVPAPGVLV